MKPWYALVGEAPSSSTDGEPPFSGRSGRRLAELIGIRFEDLPCFFELHNLFDRYPGSNGKGSDFPLDLARDRARELAPKLVPHALPYRRVILAGHRVAQAFGLGTPDPTGNDLMTWVSSVPRLTAPELAERDFIYAVVPHPSGVNQWWNEPGNVQRAARFLRECARSSTACPSKGSLDGWADIIRLRREIELTDEAIVRIAIAERVDPEDLKLLTMVVNKPGHPPENSALDELVLRRRRASWEIQTLKVHRFGLPARDRNREQRMIERFPSEPERAIMRALLEGSRVREDEPRPPS